MRKPPTGEPCAGEPHARFGGRGGRASFSTPISRGAAQPVTTLTGVTTDEPLLASKLPLHLQNTINIEFKLAHLMGIQRPHTGSA